MTSKLSKTIMFALAVVLVAAPLVFAQQSDRPGSSSSGMGAGTPGSATDRPSTSPGMSGSGTTGSTPGMQSPSTGTMGAQDAIPATVTEVNHQKHTVKLHMQGGEMVELKVPGRQRTGIEERAVAIIQKYHAQDSVYLSSFNPLVLYRLKQLDPTIRTVYMIEAVGEDLERLDWRR